MTGTLIVSVLTLNETQLDINFEQNLYKTRKCLCESFHCLVTYETSPLGDLVGKILIVQISKKQIFFAEKYLRGYY